MTLLAVTTVVVNTTREALVVAADVDGSKEQLSPISFPPSFVCTPNERSRLARFTPGKWRRTEDLTTYVVANSQLYCLVLINHKFGASNSREYLSKCSNGKPKFRPAA